MTRTGRLVAAGLAVLCVVVAVLLVGSFRDTGPTGSSPYAAGPASPRLVVTPAGWGHMFAQLEGTLSVNDQGCVSLGRDVVIAPYGTRVTDDGRAVVFPGDLVLPLHTGFVGGGGSYGDRAWLEKEVRGSWDDALVNALERCLGEDDASVVQVWMDAEDFTSAR